MDQITILLIGLAIIFVILVATNGNISYINTKEPYSTKGMSYHPPGGVDPYYIWRTYNHDDWKIYSQNDYQKYDEYPYDYKFKPYPRKFDRYDPYYYRHGYSTL